MGRWLVTSTPKSRKGDFLACLTKCGNIFYQKNNPKKSKKSKKVKKSSTTFVFFCFCPFCYKNVEKMFYQPQKVTSTPKSQKSKKKVKTIFFIFHILCEKKSHLYIYFLNFGPLPHLKNPYYENIKFFQKNKIFIKSIQKSVNLSPPNGGLVFVPPC